MASRKRIGLVVDATLDITLDALSLTTGRNRSELVGDALRFFIDEKLSQPAKARLKAHERQLTQLPLNDPFATEHG